jgi:hypothetical protein
MLPNALATDRYDDRRSYRPLVSVAITIVIAALFLGVITWHPRPQSALCDAKVGRTARVIADVLYWMPMGHEWGAVVYSMFAAVGLASESCALHAQ